MKSLPFVLGTFALMAGSVSLLAAADGPRPFRAGCESFTFNHFSAYEALEKTAKAGGAVIEFFPGQPLSRDDRTGMSYDLSGQQIAALKEQAKKCGVMIASYYTDIPSEEAQARRVFEFGRKLGVYSLTTESDGSIDTIEKLVKEFDIRVGFHEHAKNPGNPAYRLWDPEYVRDLVKGRDARIGACADTGHWASSGIVPMKGFQILAGRIINVHLKDRPVLGTAKPDVVFGQGVSQIKDLLAELRRQKFDGNIFVEYENNWDDSVGDVKQCLDFVRNNE
jgi:sugar phosphate isomerase/epimerase